MNQLLFAIFKVYSSELPKILHFALLAIVLQTGLGIGISLADGLFLAEVGAKQLPIVFILNLVLMIGYTLLYTLLITRFGSMKVLYGTLWFMLLGNIFIYFLLSAITFYPPWLQTITYYIIKLYSNLWFIALFTLFWNFTDRYFHLQDAKRFFPLLSSGLALGMVLGGSLVVILTQILTLKDLYWLWGIIILITLPLLYSIDKTWKIIEEDTVNYQNDTDWLSNVIQLFQDKYIIAIILSLFFTLITTAFIEFQYAYILSENKDPQQIASLFGLLYAIANAANIIINLFIINRLTLSIGVSNVIFIIPIIYFLASVYLFLDYGIYAAIIAFMAYQSILTSIDYNNYNLLFNGIDPERKENARTLIEGLVEPFALAIAGIALLAMQKFLNYDSQDIAPLSIILAIIMFFMALRLKNQYRTSMISQLKKGWLDFTQTTVHWYNQLSLNQLEILKENLNSHSFRKALWLLKTALEKKDPQAPKLVVQFLNNCNESQKNAAKFLLKEVIQQFGLDKILKQPSESLNALFLSPALLSALTPYKIIHERHLKHFDNIENPSIKSALACAYWNSWQIDQNVNANKIIYNLLHSDNKIEQIAGLKAIRYTDQRYVYWVATFIKHQDIEISIEALKTLEILVSSEFKRLTPELLNLIAQQDSLRIPALKVLKKIQDSKAIAPLIALSEIMSALEKRIVISSLIDMGLKSIPILIDTLRNPHFSYPSKALATRVLAKLSPAQLESLVQTAIDNTINEAIDNQQYLEKIKNFNQAHPYYALMVLIRREEDIANQRIDFILELLTLTGQLPDFESLSIALKSNNDKVKANALESLEQGIAKNIYNNLLLLLNIDKIHKQQENTFDKQELIMLLKNKFQQGDSIIQASIIETFTQLQENSYDLIAKVDIHQHPLLETTVFINVNLGSKHNFSPLQQLFYLLECKLFENINLNIVESIRRKSQLLEKKAGESLDLSQETYLFIIIQGKIQENNVLFSQGEVVGKAYFYQKTIAQTAMVIEDCIVIKIDIQHLKTVAKNHIEMATKLLYLSYESH